MKTKNVYIYTDNFKRDFEFRQKDIKEKHIELTDVFTDTSFNNAYRRDVAQGFGKWDKIRIVNANGREEIYTKNLST